MSELANLVYQTVGWKPLDTDVKLTELEIRTLQENLYPLWAPLLSLSIPAVMFFDYAMLNWIDKFLVQILDIDIYHYFMRYEDEKKEIDNQIIEQNIPSLKWVELSVDATFESLLDSEGKVFIYYVDNKCSTCGALDYLLQKIAGEIGTEEYSYLKVDISELGPLAARFGINGVPSIQYFLTGDRKDEIASSEQKEIKKWFEQIIQVEIKNV